MKVVIDIPDSVYDGIRNMTEGKGIIEYNAKSLYNAIYYGTPLPKNHGRLIDADKMIGDILTLPRQYEVLGNWCIQVTEGQPTIIEADKEIENESSD